MKVKILEYKEVEYVLNKILSDLKEKEMEPKSIDELIDNLKTVSGIVYYFWDYDATEEHKN